MMTAGILENVGEAGPEALVRPTLQARIYLSDLADEARDDFLRPDADDVGRRFLLAAADPLTVPARHQLIRQAARWPHRHGPLHTERRKAVVLVDFAIQDWAARVLRSHGHDGAVEALRRQPIRDVAGGAAMVAVNLRDYAAELEEPALGAAIQGLADAADCLEALFDPGLAATALALTTYVAEVIGDVLAQLVKAQFFASGEAFSALSAVEGVS